MSTIYTNKTLDDCVDQFIYLISKDDINRGTFGVLKKDGEKFFMKYVHKVNNCVPLNYNGISFVHDIHGYAMYLNESRFGRNLHKNDFAINPEKVSCVVDITEYMTKEYHHIAELIDL